jgi:hypothetical protein
MEGNFVLLIEGLTALKEKYVSKLLVRYASLLRRSNMGAGSILAAIDH